ncbi:hypothetical protein [Tenacibaculum mesophilum]|nr:hypothetical protein [Tenacibaculum mesophilum]QFS28692.1 hypothetical protein F9Y86_09920 [Tenacibaculum mesophilum]
MNKSFKAITYSYHFKDEKKHASFLLTYSDYDDYDDYDKNINKRIKFKINQSFINRNKDIIVTPSFIKKIGYYEFSKLIGNSKTIFLIDKDEIKEGKVLIRHVKPYFFSEE